MTVAVSQNNSRVIGSPLISSLNLASRRDGRL
jgi:hypothetical protein